MEDEKRKQIESDKRQYKDLMDKIAAMSDPHDQLAVLQTFLHEEKQKTKTLMTKHNKMRDQKDKLTKWTSDA